MKCFVSWIQFIRAKIVIALLFLMRRLYKKSRDSSKWMFGLVHGSLITIVNKFDLHFHLDLHGFGLPLEK